MYEIMTQRNRIGVIVNRLVGYLINHGVSDGQVPGALQMNQVMLGNGIG